MQLMGRLCQVIVGALHELLTSNIRVMSAAALASLFLEMNFIEGIIPSSLKNDQFDDSIEQSYELMLRRLLELVKRKPPSSSSQLAQVWRHCTQPFLLRMRTAALVSLACVDILCPTRTHMYTMRMDFDGKDAELHLCSPILLCTVYDCLHGHVNNVAVVEESEAGWVRDGSDGVVARVLGGICNKSAACPCTASEHAL